MRGIDQRLEIVRAAIGAVRRIKQDAVIAPVPAAGKIRNRHQLDRGEARGGDVIEPLDRRAEASFACERTDMQLKKYALVPGAAGPIAGLPPERILTDDLARPMRVVGLEARGRVRHGPFFIDEKMVTRTGPCAGDRGCKPSVAADALHLGAVIADELDPPRGGRP